MRVAFDTNRYRDFCEGDAAAVDVMQRAEQVHLPFVTVAELRAGFLVGTRGGENERVLRQVLAAPRVSILYPTEATTRQYAQLYLQLRTQGTPIPSHDLWIAALVLESDILLFSRDAHFDRLPQLPRAAPLRLGGAVGEEDLHAPHVAGDVEGHAEAALDVAALLVVAHHLGGGVGVELVAVDVGQS